MAFNPRLDPWIGDQRRRIVQAQAEPIIDKPICHDPIGDAPEEKVARQKRREAIGQRYLAGRGAPFILSAQLKGPFDKSSGWKNPWLPEEEDIEPRSKENIRPLLLQKAFRDNASLTGRVRNGSVASVRSVISIGSTSQSMAGDRLNSVRQAAAKPNLHGGLKQFLGATAGTVPSSTRKPDRDNIPQLPSLKRKADTSWLKGADIVKKRRKELPDIPSPTPPSRVSQDQRQFVTPTNILDKFRQHSQAHSAQVTPSTKRPAITSSQNSAFPQLDIPTPSQGYSPPFKKQRQSLLKDAGMNLSARGDTNAAGKLAEQDDKKIRYKSRLSQVNRRSTSDASVLTAVHEEPAKPLAARVRSLNDNREVVASGSFQFRRTKRAVPEYVSDEIISSIEKDDDDEHVGNDEVTEQEVQPKLIKAVEQPERKAERMTAAGRIVDDAVQQEEVSHEVPVDDVAENVADTVTTGRIRNSCSLPSDSETESPEKSPLSATKEQKLHNSGPAGPVASHNELLAHNLSSQPVAPSTAEEPSISLIAESQSQNAQHKLTTIEEVTEPPNMHADGSLPTIDTCTSVVEELVMDVVQDEMLHKDEGDTTMPDIPESTPEVEEAMRQDEPREVVLSQDVAETTYVQMASGSLSTGGNPTVSQSTAMNTQAIEAIKANLLEEDDDEDIMAPAPQSTSSPKLAVRVNGTEEEEEEESDLSQSILRSQARPQISSSEPTNTATSRPNSQAGVRSSGPYSAQQNNVAKSTESSDQSQYAQRWRNRPHISDSEPTVSDTTGSMSQIAATSAGQSSMQQSNVASTAEASYQALYGQRQNRPQISDSEPTISGTTASVSQAATSAGQSSMQQASVPKPTVDDILRVLRSSQHCEDSQHESTPTQASQNTRVATSHVKRAAEGQVSNQEPESTQEHERPISSPSHSQVYSHAGSQVRSSQFGAQVQSQSQSQPQSYVHPQDEAQVMQDEDSSVPTNTGTTTTESLLLQAIAQDMAREDEGAISMTGLTESTNEMHSGESESTPKHSLSQRIAAVSTEEVLVEKPSNLVPQHSDGPIMAPEVLQEPETQSWHISVVEDSTMLDVGSDATDKPHSPTEVGVVDSKPTSSPPPSMIPASVEEAPAAPPEPNLSLSDNPWANGTQVSPEKPPARSSPKKRVAFSDPPTSSSVDDDDLDRPQALNVQPSSPPQSTTHLPSSPPPRILKLAAENPPRQQEIPIFSPPPVYHEPPSTESPFPIIINGLRNRQPQIPMSSQGVGGMANAFLAADKLVTIPELDREDTLPPPPRPNMAPPRPQTRAQTPPPQSDAAISNIGQSSAARQLAAMYPSSSEDEADPDSPIIARQRDESPGFASQEMYNPRVQVGRSPSTILDPFANPWLTQVPAVPEAQEEGEEGEEGDGDYDELPPFAMGNILGMLGDEFGCGRPREEEGVGQVADEMSDLLETWDVDEELRKAGREGKRNGEGGRKSSARERVGRGRF